jgi:hypothetical protein
MNDQDFGSESFRLVESSHVMSLIYTCFNIYDTFGLALDSVDRPGTC